MTAGGRAAASCVLTPETTEGPYYLDTGKVRADITEGRPGVLLELAITVVDASTCNPVPGAAVDIWHCDAGGVYSGFGAASRGGEAPGGGPGAGGRPYAGQPSGGPPGGGSARSDDLVFLRGTQLTGGSGVATFTTIYPGWYRGRAVHIHMKVHRGGPVVHTGQLFFDDALTDKVYAASPYSGRGARDVRNGDDSIYGDAGAASAVLRTTPKGTGYAGATTVGVRAVKQA